MPIIVDTPKRCFIAMPITTRPEDAERYSDEDHFKHVMEHLFVPAIEAAGFEAVRPDARGSTMIHAGIIKNLEECDMVLCDLSSQNANVVFELGVRTSLDKPIAIVRDDKTEIPFDLGVLNAHTYSSDLRPWSVGKSLPSLKAHIEEAERTCEGRNPMWQQYGLTFRAQEADADVSPEAAANELILGKLRAMELQMEGQWDRIDRALRLPRPEVTTRSLTASAARFNRARKVAEQVAIIARAHGREVTPSFSEEDPYRIHVWTAEPIAEVELIEALQKLSRSSDVQILLSDPVNGDQRPL